MLYHELLTSETVIYEAAGTADDGTQAIDQSSSTHRGTRLGLCFPGAVHRVGAYNFEPDVRSVAGISNDPKTGPALLRAYPNPHKYSGSQPPESQFSFLRPQRTEAASLSTFDIAFAHYRNEGSPFFSAATQALTDARLLRD
jgi:hypothetical protein